MKPVALSQSGIGRRRAASFSHAKRSSTIGTCLLLLAGGCCAAPCCPETARTVDLVVAATTDIHGYVRGWDYYANAPDTARGLARAATIVDSLRRVSPACPVVVDAGDILQGNPLAYVAAPRRHDA